MHVIIISNSGHAEAMIICTKGVSSCRRLDAPLSVQSSYENVTNS